MLSLKDVSALAASSKTMRTKLANHASMRVHRSLSPYFDDVELFCGELVASGALVGGSSALSILVPGSWTPSDLDIVVSQAYSPRMTEFLLAQGYTKVQSNKTFYQRDESSDRPETVFTHVKFAKGTRSVDLCIATLVDAPDIHLFIPFHGVYGII